MPWVSAALLLTMAATLATLFWYPIRKARSYQEVNYNEGWNAYRQAMAARGAPLYGAPQTRLSSTTAYPPLSFHLIGWLGKKTGNFTQAGRQVALVSLLAAGIMLTLIVRHTTSDTRAALFAFLLYELGLVLLLPDYMGMNDPQLPAEALCAAALYLYWRGPDSPRLLCLSAAIFLPGGLL